MTSYLFDGADLWLLVAAAVTYLYAFRLIPTIRITKETHDD